MEEKDGWILAEHDVTEVADRHLESIHKRHQLWDNTTTPPPSGIFNRESVRVQGM